MEISFTTKDLLQTLNALPRGSIMAYGSQISTLPSRRLYNTQAFFDYLCKRGIRLIVYNFLPPAPLSFEIRFREFVRAEEKYNYKYGVDWVVFPFLGGDEAAVATVAANMRYFDKDYYGNPTDSLPLMKSIYTLKDVDICSWEVSEISFIAAMVRQWPAAYGVRAVNAGAYTYVAPYYGKYVFGTIDGSRGGTEFEYATGYNGEALMAADMRNMLVIAVIALLILGNVGEYAKDLEKRRIQRGVVQ